ncbi:MAG: arsenosugar biosynthesis arsenite methyltransferase ArsM [Acidobacteria bacterium]|uniref:Arsenosugar biosynthesis arsenite methyltransferase ArsM n=1 Tax=Candidatus Polarisedimenticola svalbardensis TaxID=2886004 RepID=A0A8J6Y2A6_9BACT|nr:arsenosugar biosynthesis arsenite methyltransferase ArsM [Candidatus Polarisedimenticola svalbardensis]
MSYLKTTRDFYKDAALSPDEGLCCTTSPSWSFPGLKVPSIMNRMNYGCGTTVHPADLAGNPTVLYVGVGGGLELLQFTYFSRKPGGVIGVDPVPEMLEACRRNFAEAAGMNDWLQEDFVSLRSGDALNLEIEDSSVDVAAQNCLFNIFKEDDLKKALAETCRVLKPGGRFVLSDPVTPVPLPDRLTGDDRLRAMCLSGSLTYQRYVELMGEAGFGTIQIRARRPYRMLDRKRYGLEEPVLLESLEVAAIKTKSCCGLEVFTGRTAIYHGEEEYFDDGAGLSLTRDMPVMISDRRAEQLRTAGHPDLTITEPTWHFAGGSGGGSGCC